MKNTRLIKFVTMLGLGVSLLGIGSVTANASSKPYIGSFSSRKITYHIDSTSKHWKDNWKGAIKLWNDLHVVKLRAAKKASNAEIRLTTKKYIKGGIDFSTRLSGSQGRGGLFYSKIALNRHVFAKFYPTEKQKEQMALRSVGVAIGLDYSDDPTSALALASKPSAQDKANLKLAYKGIK
ncbi:MULTISPECIES: hypothetical protein [Levilactobacillus]|uniref:Uncharacterized protein n=1 Tax=Levilactobacillus tongjiangensis TaxID=2486023 RepID=A0ABW1SR07_9LACO|nr:hypothetical protein [Levilactobacillus tongjiangensis]